MSDILKPHLPPTKRWLWDRLKSAGSVGIEAEALWQRLCIASPRTKNRNTLKVHINQLNNMIAPTGWRIIYERHGRAENTYRLISPSPCRSSS
jgi:hypothetical protein